MSKVYAIVTEKIVKALEAGVVPWRKPWDGATESGRARSLSTGKEYRGVNAFLLHPLVCGYSSVWWGSFKEIQNRGGRVKKGEKSSTCVFFKFLDGEEGTDGKRKRIPLLLYHPVFNLDQTEGIVMESETVEREFVPLDECERVVASMPNAPVIGEDGRGKCFYSPALDKVSMTPKRAFKDPTGWYGTLFHELVHSTGHRSRVGRDLSGGFGSQKYGREELVAEMGAAMLCWSCGISPLTLDNSASYIQSWLKTLKEDSKAVVVAAGAAAKAVEFITGAGGGAVEDVEEPAFADSLF